MFTVVPFYLLFNQSPNLLDLATAVREVRS